MAAGFFSAAHALVGTVLCGVHEIVQKTKKKLDATPMTISVTVTWLNIDVKLDTSNSSDTPWSWLAKLTADGYPDASAFRFKLGSTSYVPLDDCGLCIRVFAQGSGAYNVQIYIKNLATFIGSAIIDQRVTVVYDSTTELGDTVLHGALDSLEILDVVHTNDTADPWTIREGSYASGDTLLTVPIYYGPDVDPSRLYATMYDTLRFSNSVYTDIPTAAAFSIDLSDVDTGTRTVTAVIKFTSAAFTADHGAADLSPMYPFRRMPIASEDDEVAREFTLNVEDSGGSGAASVTIQGVFLEAFLSAWLSAANADTGVSGAYLDGSSNPWFAASSSARPIATVGLSRKLYDSSEELRISVGDGVAIAVVPAGSTPSEGDFTTDVVTLSGTDANNVAGYMVWAILDTSGTYAVTATVDYYDDSVSKTVSNIHVYSSGNTGGYGGYGVYVSGPYNQTDGGKLIFDGDVTASSAVRVPDAGTTTLKLIDLDTGRGGLPSAVVASMVHLSNDGMYYTYNSGTGHIVIYYDVPYDSTTDAVVGTIRLTEDGTDIFGPINMTVYPCKGATFQLDGVDVISIPHEYTSSVVDRDDNGYAVMFDGGALGLNFTDAGSYTNGNMRLVMRPASDTTIPEIQSNDPNNVDDGEGNGTAISLSLDGTSNSLSDQVVGSTGSTYKLFFNTASTQSTTAHVILQTLIYNGPEVIIQVKEPIEKVYLDSLYMLDTSLPGWLNLDASFDGSDPGSNNYKWKLTATVGSTTTTVYEVDDAMGAPFSDVQTVLSGLPDLFYNANTNGCTCDTDAESTRMSNAITWTLYTCAVAEAMTSDSWTSASFTITYAEWFDYIDDFFGSSARRVRTRGTESELMITKAELYTVPASGDASFVVSVFPPTETIVSMNGINEN